MRFFQHTNRGLMVAVLLGPVLLTEPFAQAQDSRDPWQPNTVWKGAVVCKSEYVTDSKPVPVVLYVKQRKGPEFEGVTWYPTEGNRLILVTGKVGEKGTITFSEKEVFHDQAATKGTVVIAAMKFTGQRENITVKGTGEWAGPNFNGPIGATFHLKRAD